MQKIEVRSKLYTVAQQQIMLAPLQNLQALLSGAEVEMPLWHCLDGV